MSKSIGKVLVPELRFPEFRDAGEWSLKPLGNLCVYWNGASHESSVTENGSYYMISLNSIDIDGNLKPDMKRLSYTDNSLQKNDLVMVLSDVAHGNFLGLTDIIPDNHFVLNQRMAGLRLKDTSIGNIGFLRTYINYNQKYFKQCGQGSSQLNLSKSSVTDFPVLTPRPKEQQKIADCLSSIDNLITAHTQKHNALKAHKKGLMQQLFPAEGETLPKLRFPEFRDVGNWGEKTLEEIGEFIGGGTPDTSVSEYWGGDIQWFTPSEIKKQNLSTSRRTITEKGLRNSSAKLLPEGALLLSTRATIGEIGIANNPCTTNQGFQSLLVNSSNVNVFWYYWIIQHKNDLIRRSSGSTFLEIGKTEIKKIGALLPIKDEQQKIADCLSSIDDIITNQTKKIESLKTHKKGLMQQLFPAADEEGDCND